MMRNRDTPARPSRHGDKQGGLTKREKYAMRFALEILRQDLSAYGYVRADHVSERAARLADALFDELEKGDE